MALTFGRWIIAVTLGCSLVTAAYLGRSDRARRATAVETAEELHYRRINRRTIDVTRRWMALTQRDAALALLPPLDARDTRRPRIIADPRLPAASASLLERTVERQWRSLDIDSAMVPVAVVLSLDTATYKNRPNPRTGELAYAYSLGATTADSGAGRCVTIVSIRSAQLARPGSHRRLAELLGPGRGGPALLGPCAFQARFGRPGPEVEKWLRARSYDLASRASWEARESNAGTEDGLPQRATPASMHMSGLYASLSPDALACASGEQARCETTLAVSSRPGERVLDGGLVMMTHVPSADWRGLQNDYLADMVTALGPERFGRFWRSELPPDAALRAVARLSLNAWTHQWAAAYTGPLRMGPAVSLREVLGGILLGAVYLALTAWGWGRRQVR